MQVLQTPGIAGPAAMQPPRPRQPRVTQPLHAVQPGPAHATPAASAATFASHRLQQLQQMGIDPYQFQQPSEPGHGQDLAALWRQVSPIMGAILQAHAGVQPTADLSRYGDAIQQVIAQALQAGQTQQQPPAALPFGAQY